ncbi:MAG: malonyl-CoA decarboxylase family protein [Rhodospirillaceae bacterium]
MKFTDVMRQSLLDVLRILGLSQETSRVETMTKLCERLVSSWGEKSGAILADQILSLYAECLPDEKQEFYLSLSSEFYRPDNDSIDAALKNYQQSESERNLQILHLATESRRQILIRRLNHGEDATRRLIRMRGDLLELGSESAYFEALDTDFSRIFSSWFNPGFLELRKLDWDSPASILGKLIQYEAVHAITSWEALRLRVEPPDRRSYAFFHPRIPNDPLIFVEVALTCDMPASIEPLLSEERTTTVENESTHAVFYSISSCQAGLHGISFGNTLIKSVVAQMRQELPQLKKFVTLSPMPGFAAWVRKMGKNSDTHDTKNLVSLAAEYLTNAKNGKGEVLDPVARFHLHNGARLERICLDANLSTAGQKSSFGVMVNYLYDLEYMERNHLRLLKYGQISTSRAIRADGD